MILPVEELEQRFDEILTRSRGALLCGAGISISAGIPDAINITEELLRIFGCDADGLLSFYGIDDPEKSRKELPVAFEAVIGIINEKVQFMDDKVIFMDEFARNFTASPSSGHFFWTKLLRDKKLSFIATTNFDTCFEQSLGILPNSQRIIYPYSDTVAEIQSKDIEGKLVKLHGCMSDPYSLGTTIQQISDRRSVNNLNVIVEKMFLKNNHDSLFIVGYSCSDGMDIIPKIENIGRSHHASKKVQIIYWLYTVDKTFTWNLLHEQEKSPEGDKLKIIFKNYPNTVIIQGDLDHFIQVYTKQLPIPSKRASFRIDRTLKNPYLTLGSIFLTAGFYDRAIKYMLTDISVGPDRLGSKLFTSALVDVGNAYNTAGNFKRALRFHKRALKLTEKDPSSAYEAYAKIYLAIGEDYWDKGEFEMAIDFYQKAVQFLSGDFEKNLHLIAEAYNNLGDAFILTGEHKKAVDYCQQSVKIRRKLFGEINNQLSNSYNNLGFAYSAAGNYRKAIFYHKKARNIRQAIFGFGHDWVAQSEINIGAAYFNRGDFRSSITYYKKALNIYKKRVRADYHMLAVVNNNIAHSFLKIARYDHAIEHYKVAEDIWTSNFGRKYFYLALLYNGMGKAYRELGDCKNALRNFKKGITVAKMHRNKANVQYDELVENVLQMKKL